jgi:hypothetical protein
MGATPSAEACDYCSTTRGSSSNHGSNRRKSGLIYDDLSGIDGNWKPKAGKNGKIGIEISGTESGFYPFVSSIDTNSPAQPFKMVIIFQKITFSTNV